MLCSSDDDVKDTKLQNPGIKFRCDLLFVVLSLTPRSKLNRLTSPAMGIRGKTELVTKRCGVRREKEEISFTSALERRDALNGMVSHKFDLGPRGSRILGRRKGEGEGKYLID